MASRGINKVILIGNLGADPEVRFMPSGDAVANVRLATSESWKDRQSGEMRERTEWHNVVFFGKLAEIVQQYLRKGSQVYVEGKLRTRKWQGKDGQDRYSTEVVVDINGSMQMLGGRSEGGAAEFRDSPRRGAGQRDDYGAAAGGSGHGAPASGPSGSGGFGDDQDFDDDVPF